MPLVMLCGFPSSGKTTRAKELHAHFRENTNKNVVIIGDQDIGFDKNSVYAESRKEKEIRSSLKSSVQRLLNKEDLIILDSANYIKGFRYELFCVSKSANTPQCVVLCDTNAKVSLQWNNQRPAADQYTQEVFDGLFMRFEPPNSHSRWDNPLFIVQTEDVLPCQQIYEALYERKAPTPNASTQSQPLSSTNFLYELDRLTKEVTSIIMSSQKTSVPGDEVSIPGANDKEQISLTRHLTLSELQRHRRQFITYTKSHAVEDTSKLCNMFVQYLNASIR